MSEDHLVSRRIESPGKPVGEPFITNFIGFCNKYRGITMIEFQTMDDVLDFAIEREQEAHDFYMDLAGKMEVPAMKKVFVGFATEELGHKKKLELAREGKFELGESKKVDDLKIADYVVDVEPKDDMDYQDALVLAMKKEKAAFKLYMDLSNMALDPQMIELFINMAQEEAKHKLRFELEYDENVLQWN
jgi:rubrerythrin